MRVVVTGSSGLLGRHVAAALGEAGHDVTGVDAIPPPPGAGWRHVTADATDTGAMMQVVRGCDAVAHIAAIPRPTGRVAEAIFRDNATATFNVVEAAVLNQVPRLVYASSMSILGYPFFERPVVPAYLPFDSAHPPAPQDAYALSKWVGEEIVAAAVRRSGLAAVSLRMPWIQTPATFPLEVVARRERAALVARDRGGYIDARDAASAFVAAAERPVTGHLRLFISAADTFMDAATETLVRAAYPGVRMNRALPGHETVFDLAEAHDLLGWSPRHSWRDY